jgi:nucleoside-diphosphate-sugar epimerase
MSVIATGLTGTIGKHIPTLVKSLEIDLGSTKNLSSKFCFNTDDNFLHMAAVVGNEQVKSNLKYSRKINVGSTLLLGRKFLRESTGIFCFASTSHVYSSSNFRLNEQASTNPTSEYARQKLDAELGLNEIFKFSPERLCIIRIFSILDWDMPNFTLGGAVRKLAEGSQDFTLLHCDDIRDFLTPSSVASALYRIVCDGIISGVVNLCGGIGISVGEAATKMLVSNGFNVPTAKLVKGNSKTPYLVGDNHRLRSFYPDLDLDWRPSLAAR